jgi:hypothetical protein
VAEENLGTAVLRIVVDDEPARNALNLLKRDVEATAQQATRARSTRTAADPAETARRRAERAAEQAANKRVSIQNRINLLEAKGADVTAFRIRARAANLAVTRSEFDVARNINSQLSRALSTEENRLRVSAAQTAQLKRQEAATKSVASTETTRAQKPTGVGFATTPEQILAGRGGTQKGAANSINTINTALDKAVQLRNRLNVLDAKGADVSKLRATYEEANAAATQSQFGTSQRLLQNLARQISLAENDLRVANLREAAAKRRLKTASDTTAVDAKGQPPPPPGLPPVGVVPALPKGYFAQQAREAEKQAKEAQAASRRQQAATQSQRRDLGGRINSGLIGGAFPLLFGQGGGASIGGLLGGVAGGGAAGFGASLVGTLVGSQIDLLNQRFGELATALKDPIASFDVFIQKATLASTAQESLAKALQETGQNAAAAALIEQEASRTIDPVVAQAVVVSQDKFNRALSDTSDILGQIVSGPARGFVDFLTSVLQGISGPPQFAGESPAAQRERSITNARRRSQGGLASAGLGLSLILGGALAIPGGITTLPGALAIGTGASLIGGGIAGGTAAETDVRVASSKEVIAAEAAVTAAKEKQVQLEKQILQARASGKKGLEEQLSLSAQFNALRVQELQGLSRIQQELASKKDNRNDAADQKEAIRQEKELAQAIELRRQALLAASSAAQTASVKDLNNARQLQGKSGPEREILSTQLKVTAAIEAANQAQLQLNKARKEGANETEIEAQGKIVNTLINQRETAAIEGADALTQAAKALTEAVVNLRDNLTSAVVGVTAVRSDPEGLNKFLSSAQVLARQNEDFKLLEPELRAAQVRFTELTGAQAPEFRPGPQGVSADTNESIRDFINKVQAEGQANVNLAQAQQALATNLDLYNKNIEALSTVTKVLSEKNWAVNVDVRGGSASTYGDVVNGAVSP